MKVFWKGDSSGMMVVEAMIILLITITVLVFLMGIGFLFYQQWNVYLIANDAATRIAQNYPYTGTDPVMGYLDSDILSAVSPYRYMFSSKELAADNADKGEKYVRWNLSKTSLCKAVSDPVVSVTTEYDSLARRHVEVTIEAEYEIPLGGALEYFGLPGTVTFSATGRAVCIDLMNYVSTVNTMKTMTDATLGSKYASALNAILSTIKGFVDWLS